MKSEGEQVREAFDGGRPYIRGGSCSYEGHMCSPVSISITAKLKMPDIGFWIEGKHADKAIAALYAMYDLGRAHAEREAIASAPAGHTIILISQDDGVQTHGLFATFDDALAHAKKDGLNPTAQWIATEADRCEVSDGKVFWTANREPVRVSAPAGDHVPDAGNMIAPAGDGTTVEFVREWLMSGDHSVSDWERQFAAAIDARPRAAVGEPVAYLHTLHMEGGQTMTRLSDQDATVFGLSGRDYSEEYTVTTTPLYALQSAPAKVEPCVCERAAARGTPMMCLTCERTGQPSTQQERAVDYKPAFDELFGHLKWIHDCRALKGHLGKNIAQIATDLIRDRYPELAVPEVSEKAP